MRDYKNEEVFLELIRCGIWGKMPNLDYFKGLTQFDWLEIYMIAGKQTVLGFCLKPILALPNDLKPPTKLLLQWVGVNRFIEANNHKMMQVWQELNEKFEQAGIFPVIMKGMSIAKWYAHPMSRQSSDIDIFIPEKFSEAIQLVRSWGIECVHKPQHDVIIYRGITVEIHPRIMPSSHCSANLNYEIKEELIGKMVIRVLDVNTNSLLLLSHAGGHFINPGIGYRFLCDWAVFLKQNHNKIDYDFVLQESKRMGMYHFVVEFTKLAETDLQLDFPDLNKWTIDSKEKYRLRLSNLLLEQGDFGAINFQNDYKGSKFIFACHLIKSLLSCRYYWPRLFWRRVPRMVFKLVLKQFIVPTNSQKQ